MYTNNATPFDGYLLRNETLLWTGHPNPFSLFTSMDLFLVPFSLMWGGFAIVWEASVVGNGAPSLFTLWGIPFIVVGQYLIWGRFLHKYLRRRQTYYAITDRRALILSNFFRASLTSFLLHQMSSLHWRGRTILFDLGHVAPYRNWQDWSGELQPGFYALSDPDEAYHLLQDLIVPTQ